MFENNSTYNKKILLVIGILILILAITFLFFFLTKKSKEKIKTFSLPSGINPDSPEGISIRYLFEAQEGNLNESEKYLFSIYLTEIFEKPYYRVSHPFPTPERTGELPNFQVIDRKIGEKTSKVILREITNKNEGEKFFGFTLPLEITFEILLFNENGSWKIIKIDSPNLIRRVTLGERVEIKNGFLITALNIENSTLKVGYENNTNGDIEYNPFAEWKIVDVKNNIYMPSEKEGGLSQGILKPNEKKEGYLEFEIPKNIIIKEVIFEIPSKKKVIFEIPIKSPSPLPEEPER